MNILSSVMAVFTLIIGLFVGLKLKNSEVKKLSEENNILKSENKTFSEKVENLVAQSNSDRAKVEILEEVQKKNEELSEKINELSKEISADKTKLEVLNQLQEIVKIDFTEIANKVLKSEQSDMREQNREALEEKLKPIKEDFEKFREKVEEFNKQGESNTATLKEKIENLVKESRAIGETAADLTNAIKTNSQARGEFGEIILENLLKQAGLVNKRDDAEKGNYITQQTFKDSSAPSERPRPDVVLDLPENKNIIIDSKCPLKNFIDFCNSNDDEVKNEQLKCFYDEVTKMIDDLSGKYNALEGLHTPEFKLMFLPLESCASYIYSNQKIITYAWSKNIFIVCPSTLLATLKLIGRIWTQQNQSNELENILKTASTAYEKLVVFLERLEKIRTSFNSTSTAFDNAFKTLEGRGGLVDKIAALEKLDIHPTKKIPEKYKEIVEVE